VKPPIKQDLSVESALAGGPEGDAGSALSQRIKSSVGRFQISVNKCFFFAVSFSGSRQHLPQQRPWNSLD